MTSYDHVTTAEQSKAVKRVKADAVYQSNVQY